MVQCTDLESLRPKGLASSNLAFSAMEFTEIDKYPDLKSKFVEIDKKMLEQSRKRLNKETKISEKILNSVNNGYFQLRKDLLILSGTIFGSSIALSAGRDVNIYFIIGEFLLFISIVSGLIMLLSYLEGKEWLYSFSSKNSLESYLLLNRDKIEKFELDSTDNLIKDYKNLMKSNQNGFLYFLLKKISLEKWPLIFNLSFLMGILLILFSIIPLKSMVNNTVKPINQVFLPTIIPVPTDIFYVPLK